MQYVVEYGDWLAKIAEEHGTTVAAIWNHPNNAEHRRKRGSPDVLYPGDVLFIPGQELVPPVAPPVPPAPPLPPTTPPTSKPWPYPPATRPQQPGPSWTCPGGTCSCHPIDGEKDLVEHRIVFFDARGHRLPRARFRVKALGKQVHADDAAADDAGGYLFEIPRGVDTLELEWAPAEMPDDPTLPYRTTYHVHLGTNAKRACWTRLTNLGLARHGSLRESILRFEELYELPRTGDPLAILPRLVIDHDPLSKPRHPTRARPERPGLWHHGPTDDQSPRGGVERQAGAGVTRGGWARSLLGGMAVVAACGTPQSPTPPPWAPSWPPAPSLTPPEPPLAPRGGGPGLIACGSRSCRPGWEACCVDSQECLTPPPGPVMVYRQPPNTSPELYGDVRTELRCGNGPLRYCDDSEDCPPDHLCCDQDESISYCVAMQAGREACLVHEVCEGTGRCRLPDAICSGGACVASTTVDCGGGACPPERPVCCYAGAALDDPLHPEAFHCVGRQERCPPGPAQLSVRMECRADADCLEGDVCCVNGPALLCGKQCPQKACTTDGDCEGSDEAGPGECVSNGLLSACR